MDRRFIDSAGQLTESALANAEKMFGRNIPDPYRSFLLKHNGGRPELNEFRMAGSARPGAIKSFFGIGMSERTLNLDYALEAFADRIPAWSFPLARDPGGNLILLAAEGSRKGRVYFWDHEREADDGEPPREDNLYLISDSFEEFLAQLKAT